MSSQYMSSMYFHVYSSYIRIFFICTLLTPTWSGDWAVRCRSAVEKKTVLENLDLVLLAMDEIVDKG